MSADNAYFVISNGEEWRVKHGFMSPFLEDEKYIRRMWQRGVTFNSRADALVNAHDLVAYNGAEYGVVEVEIDVEPEWASEEEYRAVLDSTP